MMAQSRSLRHVYRKLVSSPFFPILFIGEAIKTGVVTFTEAEPVIAYAVLAVIATILWALSDSVDVSFDKEGFVGD